MDEKVELAAAPATVGEPFRPRIVAALNDYNTGDAPPSALTAPATPLR
jgi:hypothetical protein